MYKILEELMKARGEKASDLSRATGIPQNVISNWKKRNKGMSVKYAIKVAEHYGVTVEDLLEDYDAKN